MIRQTSIECYNEIKAEGIVETQRIRILNHIKKYSDGLLRMEISDELNIKINAVCGRCRKLVQDGLVYEDGTRLNQKTGKKNLILKA